MRIVATRIFEPLPKNRQTPFNEAQRLCHLGTGPQFPSCQSTNGYDLLVKRNTSSSQPLQFTLCTEPLLGVPNLLLADSAGGRS